MANIKSMPTQAANLGYSGFDLSQLVKFSSTTGELLPVFYDILYPGDKVSCRSSLKTMTMPLDTAAMASITEHIEWFVVPLDQIYSLFSNMFFNINDVHSSIFDLQQLGRNSGIPYFSGQTMADIFASLPEQNPDLASFVNDKYFSGAYSPLGDPVTLRGTQLRLMEHLGIPLNQVEGATTYPNAISPILFAAYQKIYMDYYRLADREALDSKCYNLDRWYKQSIIDAEDAINFFTLRYRPARKDFFLLNYVSPLYPTSGMTSFGGTSDLHDFFQQWLTPQTNFRELNVTGSASHSGVPTSLGQAYSPADQQTTNAYRAAVSSMLSPQAIRTSFALNKMLEITRRAGKHIDQQTLAHFGVKPSRKVTGEVEFLGGSSSQISIGEVISTAETSEAALGTIAGKGYNKDVSKVIKFENNYPCPVVLMAIYSADVDLDWKQYGLDKFNTYIDRNQFYIPSFDNLGMQPLFRSQSFWTTDASQNAIVDGWQYRWQESKMKYNRVLGSIARSLDNWSVTRVVFRGSDLNNYLVSPFSLDGILFSPYRFDSTLAYESPNPEWGAVRYSSLWTSDPLIHELYFDVKKSSTMSTYGLESL